MMANYKREGQTLLNFGNFLNYLRQTIKDIQNSFDAGQNILYIFSDVRNFFLHYMYNLHWV